VNSRRTTRHCFDGWHNGECCCNCANQLELKKHPGNKTIGKGQITETMGYVCIAKLDPIPEPIRQGVFLDHQHSYCELWKPREVTA